MVNAVTYILENDSTIQTLLGLRANGDAHKVFPVVVPQGEKAPYCVVRLAGRNSIGKSCGYNYTVQVISYANSYDDVIELNDAIITTLTSEPSGTINQFDFGYLTFSNESDDFVKEHNLYAKVTTFEGAGE